MRTKTSRVSHPAHALVALRAVGGDAQIVAALAPLDVGLQLIDPRVRAGELPGRRRIAADHDACDRAERGFSGTPVNST